MEAQTETSARKRRTVSPRGERILRRHVLAELRREVARLHGIGQSTIAIGRDLGISSRDVQAFLPREKSAKVKIGLPDRAITALIRGRYAGFGGETDAARVRNLARIAACYTREELLAEPGVGIVTALRIEHWLEGRGLHLQKN